MKITLSAAEREKHQISEANLNAAVRALWDDGFVVLENVVETAHIDALKARTLADLETILARPDAPFNFNSGNVQQDPPPFAPFLFEDVLFNPFAVAITQAVLGRHPQLTMYSGNTALPGGERQPVHPDIGQLWPNLEHPTPAFGLVVNVPLVDVSEANGATEFWPGTHHDTSFCVHDGSLRITEAHLSKWRDRRPPLQAALKCGDIVMRDIRMWHAGMPNRTDEPRPMIAMIHSASWWPRGQVAFARSAQTWLEDAQTRSGLRIGAHFVDDVDYLHHNAAYDFQK